MERLLRSARAAGQNLGPAQYRRTLPWVIGAAWGIKLTWDGLETFLWAEDAARLAAMEEGPCPGQPVGASLHALRSQGPRTA